MQKKGNFYTCINCNKEVWRTPSELKKGGKNIYCSQKCCIEFRRNNKECNPNYKKENSFLCSYCNKEIRVSINKQKRDEHHFCNRECFSKWESENRVGDKSYNYKNALSIYKCVLCDKTFVSYSKNRKYCSLECKNKAYEKRLELTCDNCGCNFKTTLSHIKWSNTRGHKHNFCSQECTRAYLKGENHPSYILNRKDLKDQNHSDRTSPQMKDWRINVFTRDNYTCKMCGIRSSQGTPVILNAHHIIPFIKNRELRFDISNGITLCDVCHKKTYKREEYFEEYFNSIING